MSWFEISLFVQAYRGNTPRLKFNPYLRVGGFELCVDSDGACVHLPRRSYGFIWGSGFWKSAKLEPKS